MFRRIVVVFCFLFLASSPAFADKVECEERKLTAEEENFYNSTLKVVKKAFPAPNSWMVLVEEDIPHRKVVCKGYEKNTMTASYAVSLKEITERGKVIDNQKSKMAKIKEQLLGKNKELQEAMVKGADAQIDKKFEEIQELQMKMQMLMVKQINDSQKTGMVGGMDAGGEKPKKPEKLNIQVMVNTHGEIIAKKYEVPMKGVIKTFEMDRGENISRKIYLGHWEVVDFDNKNWKLSRKNLPHAQAKTLVIEVRGKKALAEDYLNRINMDALKAMVK